MTPVATASFTARPRDGPVDARQRQAPRGRSTDQAHSMNAFRRSMTTRAAAFTAKVRMKSTSRRR
jgi:hypothetical protein